MSFIESLAAMQHFGAPTRLLDWTYSFYIALFFAVVDSEVKKSFAIWVLDHIELRNNAKILMKTHENEIINQDKSLKSDDIQKILEKEDASMVAYPFNPFRQTPRHILQQGMFIIPGNASKCFHCNLQNTINLCDKKILKNIVVDLTKDELEKIMLYLYRSNITMESLFPGPEGFARSLNMYVNIEVARPAGL